MFNTILLQDMPDMAPDSMGTGTILFLLVLVIIMIIAEWKIYEKAGKPGWAVLIPIYNVIVMLEIIGKPWWWLLLLLIPGVNFVISIMMVYYLAKSFGYGVAFTLGLIFLNPIFILILGFGDAKYVGPAGGVQPPAI
jgi:hypothetical protein